MKRYKFAGLPYIVWSIIFVLVPLGIVAVYALTTPDGTWTISNISKVSMYTPVFMRSIWFAFLATIICLLLGYPLAFIMSRMLPNKQRTMVMLIMLPMWINFLLRTYSWMTILENNGIINSIITAFGFEPLRMINTQGAVILGMVYNYLPFMILPLYTIMIKIDKSIIEAAKDLGANWFNTLKNVIIPLTIPAITTGITMVFVPSISTFIISRMLGGGSNMLIGDLIDAQFLGNAYNPNLGAAISLILMVFILLFMSILNQFEENDDREGMLL